MITLTVDNRFVTIEGASSGTVRKLVKVTSYLVAGHYFSPAFRSKQWDGREKLLLFSARKGYRAPSGLLLDIARCLRRLGRPFRVINKTRLHGPRLKLTWNTGITLRDYQNEALAALFSKPLPGRGILKMPIRSGKTKTAARAIYRFKLPTLFVVPSQMLLHQTKAALEESLPGVEVGLIGDGEFDPQHITVATLQTLARLRGARAGKGKRGRPRDPRYKELLHRWDVVIADEAHHIRGGGEWHKVLTDFDAKYKIALSATVFLDNETEQERGIIWVKAACGEVRIDIPTSRLIDAGHLMRQNVVMYRVTRPDANGRKWSATLRSRCIDENGYRNKLVATLAKRASARDGLKTLIIAHHLSHIAAICEELDDLGIDYRTITGRDSAEEREDKVDGLVSGDYRVLVGNVLSEGVDIPAIECVINAEGGKDVKSTIQRQRNLTVSKGKTRALLYDFFDDTNEYFRKHSEARLETYQSEPSFTVTVKNLL